MNNEELNNQLYDSLCASVLKWFEADRGYTHEVEIRIHKYLEGCKDIGYPEAVIGESIRDASFYVGLTKEPIIGDGPLHCNMSLSMIFHDEILAEDEKKTPIHYDVLNVLNRYNRRGLRFYYDEEANRIEVEQDFDFYPGSQPSDKEITQMLDEFYFSRDIEDIAELVESGGWLDPELYVKDLFVRKVNVCQ